MDTKYCKQHEGNQARYENLVGLVRGGRAVSGEPEDDHGAYGDGSEVGEEQQESSSRKPWQMVSQ